jgi:hypothetical protein
VKAFAVISSDYTGLKAVGINVGWVVLFNPTKQLSKVLIYEILGLLEKAETNLHMYSCFFCEEWQSRL